MKTSTSLLNALSNTPDEEIHAWQDLIKASPQLEKFTGSSLDEIREKIKNSQ